MKSFLLVSLLIPGIAFAASSRHPTSPTPSPQAEVGPSRQALFDTVNHIVILSQDLQKNLDNEKAAHGATETALQKANAENVDLQKKIDKETTDFNDLKDNYATVTKKLSWYRWHWWGSWIVFGLGILAVGFLAFLKFTGKLAIFGASVAAKIP